MVRGSFPEPEGEFAPRPSLHWSDAVRRRVQLQLPPLKRPPPPQLQSFPLCPQSQLLLHSPLPPQRPLLSSPCLQQLLPSPPVAPLGPAGCCQEPLRTLPVLLWMCGMCPWLLGPAGCCQEPLRTLPVLLWMCGMCPWLLGPEGCCQAPLHTLPVLLWMCGMCP